MQSTEPIRQGQRLARSAETEAHSVARQNSSWLVPLGRFGYAAIGVVYGLVAVLAFEAAVGAGGTTTDTHGALAQILQAPFGRFALGVTAFGLAGYALWRFLAAVLDTEHRGTDLKGLAARAGFVVAAVTYAGLAVSAANLLRGGNAGGGNQATQDRTAWLLSQPFGQWIVAAVGVIVIGVGLAQFYRAYRASFRKRLREDRMSDAARTWVDRLGRAGFAARGVVFVIIGGFLVVAAVNSQPGQAKGLGGALATLAAQPFGPWLLGLVALGLLAYAIFMLAEARYRQMVIT